MPSLRLTRFGGINTEVAARNSGKEVAQVAHNCLLWDGSLRPLAKWRDLNLVGYDCRSVHIDVDDVTILLSKLEDAVFLTSEVFPKSTVVGLAAFAYQTYQSNIGYTNKLNPANTSYEVSVPAPLLNNSSSVTYTPAYASTKAVNRLYAVSTIRYNGSGYEESPLTLIPNQSPQTVIYEGDLANVNIVMADSRLHERSKMRLYRSISAMDTAAGITNELDTEWFLVAELGNLHDGITGAYGYMDGGSATNLPLDMHLADRHNPPAPYLYTALAVAEGGWVSAATKDGKIAVSERYQYFGYPSENYVSLPETITDLVAHYDTLYVGTKNHPYAVSLANGEALGLQTGVVRFPASYECLTDTMDVTANGAMYATNAGIVSLTKQGMELITSGVASGVRPLYHAEYLDNTTVLHPPEQNLIVPFTTGGTLPAGAHFYVVTALIGTGETVVSNQQSTVNTGATSSNQISWEHIQQATKMRVYRGTVSGTYTTYYEIDNTDASTDIFLDINATGTAGTPPLINGAILPTVKCKPLNFRDTTHGAYFNGKYFGFAQIPRDDGLNLNLGYLFDTASTLDGEHPLQKLITFDGPPGAVVAHTVGSSGLDMLIGIPNPDVLVDAAVKNFVYSMPFPNTKKGGIYDAAPKMCYTWKSKKFVFPGNMVMSAGKIVHDCDGFVRIKVFVDCCCRYEALINDCNPFRLPASMQGIEWEIELVGTATVHEVHLASSLRELVEHDRYGDRGSGIIGTMNEQ